MATPTKIAIGWKNLCLDSGVTFTPSSEDASHDADNLGIAHPSRFWRATTVSPSCHVIVDFGADPGDYSMILPLYVTASPVRNVYESTAALQSAPAKWVETSMDWVGLGFDTALPVKARLARINGISEAIATAEHYSEHSYTFPGVDVTSDTIEVAGGVWFSTSQTSLRKALVKLTYGGSSLTWRWDETAPTVIDSFVNSGAAFTAVTHTLKQDPVATTFYYLEFTFTLALNVSDALVTRLQAIRASDDATSYLGVASTYTLYLAPHLKIKDSLTLGAMINSSLTVGAGVYQTQIDSDNAFSPATLDLTPEPLYLPENDDWKTDRGWSHASPTLLPDTGIEGGTPPGNRRYVKVTLFDPNNVDTQLDVSNIYIGLVWKPSFDLHKDFKASIDKFGRRIWDCTFPALTLDEYENQAEAMALAVGVGELDQTAAGGQDYGENRTPVVVILDPANPSQSQTLYGWIISYSASRISVESGAIRYDVKIKFREVLP